ncbi:hypothetical protein PHYBLDRAFT_144773 [Phycomyces blakesleeanus NRRL 1555(-)]|uniref:Uncharacterized protein n=1 Tax=Phycomyces blakesleeanus (strain ATCC 8743b / DSM 1359 / FGSC 10004 / NBRC 33097 / NRRL 1555) TaxID=763407 RepID=A0A162PV64_PHYB8|nr:hypothetical protein PHYBLDRAFT_144773 [Phycomyces blakesleeanus NRRL 1555(-)]OAD74326.1 hypothetical protein PHYBLDRAFT_144773 [Phycomyces blakesleeanus NRRL 1555(-)]|eukprot:XP_018292366.1 hypothetical protein PHYBLDRAFT_144773 [Phycomyces blakesleeanus NRRL 1555(-)]
MHPLHNAILPKLLSTIKHGYEHDEPPSHEHIANQELSFHTSVIDMDILQQNVILSCRFSACGKNPYTENANTSYYSAVLTFSYVQKLVLPPMRVSKTRFPKKPGGTTSVPQDTSLGQLTIDINVHESGITHHGLPPDQTTEDTHCPVSVTRNGLMWCLLPTNLTSNRCFLSAVGSALVS